MLDRRPNARPDPLAPELGTPPELDDLLARSLSRDPDQRPATAVRFAAELRAIAAALEMSEAAAPDQTVRPAADRARIDLSSAPEPPPTTVARPGAAPVDPPPEPMGIDPALVETHHHVAVSVAEAPKQSRARGAPAAERRWPVPIVLLLGLVVAIGLSGSARTWS